MVDDSKETEAKYTLNIEDAYGMVTKDLVPQPRQLNAPVVFSTDLKVKKLPHYNGLPNLKIGTAGSAGIDLYAAVEDRVLIPSYDYRIIPTGIAIQLSEGTCGFVTPRSGLAAKKGLTIVNSPGLIDSDYRGELMIILHNTTTNKFYVERGERVAQLVVQFVPQVNIEYVDELDSTERGEGKFGSTGLK